MRRATNPGSPRRLIGLGANEPVLAWPWVAAERPVRRELGVQPNVPAAHEPAARRNAPSTPGPAARRNAPSTPAPGARRDAASPRRSIGARARAWVALAAGSIEGDDRLADSSGNRFGDAVRKSRLGTANRRSGGAISWSTVRT